MGKDIHDYIMATCLVLLGVIGFIFGVLLR